jgi:ribose/xylose/arabinose/galactoside ABC-type transport system permease subunit
VRARSLKSLLRPLRSDSFRLLFLSSLVSSFGTLVAAVALTVDVQERTDSGLWVGALLVADFLPAILVGLGAGAAIGVFNGTLVAYGKLPPFIVTLGMLGIARGIVLVLTDASTVQPLPDVFGNIANGSFLGLPNLLWLAAVGGVLFTSRLNAGIPTAGTGYELNAIAACVIGGASLFGAKGGAFGAAAGALIVGTLILAAVAFDQWQGRRARSA